MSERIDVFVSSTSKDLQKYRQKVGEAVMRLGMHPIITKHPPILYPVYL
jgi:hypothetical protein